jgi:hypothetical protein
LYIILIYKHIIKTENKKNIKNVKKKTYTDKDCDSFTWQNRLPVRVVAPRQAKMRFSPKAKIWPWVPVRGSKPRWTDWLKLDSADSR